MKLMPLSPVDVILKELPKGDCNWPGYDHVKAKLQQACAYFASSKQSHLNDDHVHLMAVLGCGDQETMKFELGKAKCYGWCQ